MLKNYFSGAVRLFLPGVTASIALILSGCGSKDDSNGLPANFASLGDAQKVAYMMKSVTPDSVARFICDASLGKTVVRIDSLAEATLYAYENYRDADLQTFSVAYDEYAENLPLDEKMRLRKIAAQDDPMGLGYELGLEYVNIIRLDHKNATTVESEISALRRECLRNPEDSLTFKRFMKGFKVALEVDGSTDIPREIYNKYTRDID